MYQDNETRECTFHLLDANRSWLGDVLWSALPGSPGCFIKTNQEVVGPLKYHGIYVTLAGLKQDLRLRPVAGVEHVVSLPGT